MAKTKRKFDKREESEQNEGYPTVNTGMPSDRFSPTKQIVSSEAMGVTKDSTPESVTNVVDAAKTLKSKIKIRPDVSVDDLGGKQVGGVPLAVDTNTRNVAGARSASPADDTSRTPYSPGNYRPETRFGKKRSEDLFELDNAAIEQVVPIVDDLPDLKKSPDSSVGYNGRQQFKQTRQKKNYAFTNGDGNEIPRLPQELLNDSSVDFYDIDQVVYAAGQIVNPIDAQGNLADIDPQADYPTYNGNATLTGNDIMHKSNYMPTNLQITVADGHIVGVHIDEYKFNALANPLIRDEANMNWQVDANNIAKTMIRLQTEMGRETTDKWTPLAYVINQPYQINMLYHDIEVSLGALAALSYRASVSSCAMQRNIVKKDGINPQRNAIKMMIEGYAGPLVNNDRNTISDLDFTHMVFNQAAYQEGSAAALIDMFDSTGKYRTKADILGLQRSFGLHLSQADNNIAPFRVKPEFIKALDKAHMFSTIDGQYNPYLPIFETKRINVILPLSLNRFLRGWVNPALLTDEQRNDPLRDQTTGTYAQYVYAYNDLRNYYTTRVQHPFIEGLLLWLLKHEGAFVATYGNGTINIPFTFDMQAPAMLQMMVCSASQDIAFERNIIFRDILFAGEQSTYIWDDLKPLKDIDPLYSTQLKIGKYDEPLTLGKLAADTAIRLLYSDHKQVYDRNNSNIQYFEPWYFNEAAFANAAGGTYTINSGFFDADTPFNFSFPSIRDGVRHEYVDLIKSMNPRDVMLSLDRKLDILHYCSIINVDDGHGFNYYTEYTPYMNSSTNNNKIKISALRYDSNSDGRIVTKYLMDTGNNYQLPALGFYCIPKEIGFIDDYYGPLRAVANARYDRGACTLTILEDPLTITDTHGVNWTAYNGSKHAWLTSYRIESDSNTAASIDRSAALTSTFYRTFASRANDFAQVNDAFVRRTGLIISRAYNAGAGLEVPAVYNLNSVNESTHVLESNVITDAGFVWTTLQRWFMPVNPFANAYQLDDDNISFDPLETSFWFGVCGFLAADYTQHVLERLSIYDQLGLDYTEDTNIKDSLIFR